MAPLIVMLLWFVCLVVAAVFSVFAIIAIVACFLRNWPLAKRMSAFCGIIALLSAVGWYAIFPPDHRTSSQIAHDIMKLPPQAVIVTAQAGDSGDGDVTFTLPASKPVRQWMTIIWTANSVRNIGVASTQGNDWSGYQDSDSEFISLSYDPKAKLYTYDAGAD